ncbi:MAG: helix-turn-helix domain-containing protein [Nitrososphaera sp.]|jgi:sugar-specific transcriptional regulator TrmB
MMPKIGNMTQNQVTVANYTDGAELTSIESMRLRLEGELAAELKKLDLSSNESKILLFLMSSGSSTASEISKHTKIQRTDTYHYISLLLSKGIVFSTFSKPQKYYSLSYEETVDYLVQAKANALKEVSEKKHDCQSKLEQIAKNVTSGSEDSYQVLSGENIVFTKVSKTLDQPLKSLNVFLTDRMLAKFYHEGLIEKIASSAKAGCTVKLKTSGTAPSDDEDVESGVSSLDVETIRNPSPASFMIVDGNKLVFIIDRSNSSGREISGIYTNNEVMVSTLEYLYQKIA